MNKSTAKQYDALLQGIMGLPNKAWHISHINQVAKSAGFTTQIALDTAISTFLTDSHIAIVEHSGAPTHNFNIYHLTGKGLKFITFEGGYTTQRRFEAYHRTNIRFTFVRHWVWFYTAVVSLLANIYFILKYLCLYI